MEIEGIVYKILPREEVTFGDGTKKIKGGFVITHGIDYPSHAAFELFGEERLSMLDNITVGMPVKVSFYAESREAKTGKFAGKYFTSLKCFGIAALAAQNSAPSGMSPIQYPNAVPPTATIPPVQDTPSASGTTDFLSEDDEVPF